MHDFNMYNNEHVYTFTTGYYLCSVPLAGHIFTGMHLYKYCAITDLFVSLLIYL